MRLNHCFVLSSAALLGVAMATPASADVLLDYGTEGAGSGYAVSGTNAFLNGFTQFQLFTVPAPGWDIDIISADGFFTFNPNSSIGPVGAVVGDTGGLPDESQVFIDGLDFAWTSFGAGGGFVDVPVSLILTPGDYWLRLAAPDPDYDATWRNALSGPNGISQRGSDGMQFPRNPLAMRIEGTVGIPEPATAAVFGLFAIGLGLQRRRA